MIGTKTHGRVVLAIAAAVYLTVPAAAVTPARFSGGISGMVTDPSGVPQMGATVLLFNRSDRLCEKVLTNESGLFAFAGLLPDVYSIRVTLASFVPAIKDNILVQPGMRSMLSVSLATLFSTIRLVSPGTVEQRGIMTEDWKWVLRTAAETRPVLRLVPEMDRRSGQQQRASVFSDTRGVLRLAAGDSGEMAAGQAAEGDLGTAFALATSLYGTNTLGVAGRFGSGSQSGIPSAAFRTSFRHDPGTGSPEVSVTMRQMFLPGRLGNAVMGGDSGLPALRSMTVDFDDRTELTDTLSVRYGFSLDSVSFLDHLNYFSPYARLSYAPDPETLLEVTYTSGNARPDLGTYGSSGTELQRDLNTLAFFPRVSLQQGRAKVQRGEDYEVSLTRKLGSRTLQVNAYRESVTNAALTMDAPEGLYPGDLLPDLFSGSTVFNAGNYQSVGYTAAVTQNFGDNFSATLMYGSLGALMVGTGEVVSDNPDDLRAMIREGRRHAATLRTRTTLPWSGTHVVASYQWSDNRALTPGHLYSTDSLRPEPGLNVVIRQPIPWSPFPVRMEVTADLRNLLEQGYLPLTAVGGRRMFLMQTPRAFRGGLSFIF